MRCSFRLPAVFLVGAALVGCNASHPTTPAAVKPAAPAPSGTAGVEGQDVTLIVEGMH